MMLVPERLKRPLREGRVSRGAYMALARTIVAAQISLHHRFGSRFFSAAFFDHLFVERPDPWGYENDSLSERRRQLIVNLLPRQRYRRMLELGCAEGWITSLLAGRADSLLAMDISRIALDRAARHCLDLANVRFIQADLLENSLGGPFDAIVCAGVLPFCPRARLGEVGDKLVTALRPGGDLLLENAFEPGAGELSDIEIAACFRGHPALEPLHRAEYDCVYAITIFRRVGIP